MNSMQQLSLEATRACLEEAGIGCGCVQVLRNPLLQHILVCHTFPLRTLLGRTLYTYGSPFSEEQHADLFRLLVDELIKHMGRGPPNPNEYVNNVVAASSQSISYVLYVTDSSPMFNTVMDVVLNVLKSPMVAYEVARRVLFKDTPAWDTLDRTFWDVSRLYVMASCHCGSFGVSLIRTLMPRVLRDDRHRYRLGAMAVLNQVQVGKESNTFQHMLIELEFVATMNQTPPRRLHLDALRFLRPDIKMALRHSQRVIDIMRVGASCRMLELYHILITYPRETIVCLSRAGVSVATINNIV